MSGCCSAEFCVTSHRFRVNGRDHWVNFTAAGTKWGCTYQVGMQDISVWKHVLCSKATA